MIRFRRIVFTTRHRLICKNLKLSRHSRRGRKETTLRGNFDWWHCKKRNQMTFEPDENGYLEWEDEYGPTPEEMLEEYDSKPRTHEEMERFFADELYE